MCHGALCVMGHLFSIYKPILLKTSYKGTTIISRNQHIYLKRVPGVASGRNQNSKSETRNFELRSVGTERHFTSQTVAKRQCFSFFISVHWRALAVKLTEKCPLSFDIRYSPFGIRFCSYNISLNLITLGCALWPPFYQPGENTSRHAGSLRYSMAMLTVTTAVIFLMSDDVSFTPQSATSVEFTGVIWKTPIFAERMLPILLPVA